MTTNSKYSEKYQIQLFEANANGKISLAMMMNIMLAISEHQLDNLGISQQKLVQNYHVGWVITQYHIDVKRAPKVGETIVASTEATGYNRFFCYRDFWIHDAAGNELVSVHSTFVMMDINTRKIIPVIKEIVDKFDLEQSKHIVRFPRIPHLDKAKPIISQDYRVRYFDIDSNGHVNNTRYFDWMQDVLGYDFLQNHVIKTADVRYEREVHYGEIAKSEAQIIDANTTLHRIMNNDEVAAETKFTWQ